MNNDKKTSLIFIYFIGGQTIWGNANKPLAPDQNHNKSMRTTREDILYSIYLHEPLNQRSIHASAVKTNTYERS